MNCNSASTWLDNINLYDCESDAIAVFSNPVVATWAPERYAGYAVATSHVSFGVYP